jgi:hypothetical protein
VIAVTTLATWAAIAGPVLTVIAAVGRALNNKLTSVGEHLAAQDERHLGLVQRMSRIEGRVGLDPLPIPTVGPNGQSDNHG